MDQKSEDELIKHIQKSMKKHGCTREQIQKDIVEPMVTWINAPWNKRGKDPFTPRED